MDARSLISQGYMTENDSLDVLAMRPFRDRDGKKKIIQRNGYKFIEGKGNIPQYKSVAINEGVRQNNLLRLYEWQEIDRVVVDVMRQPIIGIADLLANGLVHPLSGLGTSISTYEQLTDMTPADVSMTIGPRKGQDDRAAFNPISVPVPIISKPFELDARMLDASRRIGESLDVTQARVATIKVRQAMEDMLFLGSTKQLAGYAIYGYTTHPKRLTDTATNYGGGSSATDGNSHKTIVGMLSAQNDQGFYGPFGLYVANDVYRNMLKLTGVNLTETQLSVILRTIPDLKFVKRSARLANGEGILVQLTPEVVDLAIGQDVTPVQWTEEGGLLAEFRVITAAVPRIKYDANGHCGVTHVTSWS
jgi:uncharacterized linocin/CFP29 family protein